jgi:hypothetical protein
MWRRNLIGGWGRRRVGAGRRPVVGFSFGTAVLVVSGGVLLLLYLLGYLSV